MDLFFYNIAALCVDAAVMFELIEFIQPLPERRKTLTVVLLGYMIVERLIVGLTDAPIEWTTLLLFLFGMLRFGTGSVKQRLIRYFVGVMFITLVANVSLPWMMVHGTNFANLRYEILSYPDYFVSQAVLAVVSVAFVYPIRMVLRAVNKQKLSSLDVPGMLYLAVQTTALTVLEVSSIKAPQYSNGSLVLVQCAMVVSFVVSLIYLRGVHLSVESSENSAYAEGIEQLSHEYIKQYSDIEQEIEAAAILRHDLRNQLQTAEALGRSGDDVAARNMLDSLEERIVTQQKASRPQPAHIEISRDLLTVPETQQSTIVVPRGRVWLIAYVASLILSVFVWIDTWQHHAHSAFVLGLCLVAIVVMAVLLPYLVRKIQEAQLYEISQVRAAAARELFDSSVYYTKRLEYEHAQLDELRLNLLREVEDIRKRLDGAALATEDVSNVAQQGGYEHFCEHSALDTLLSLKTHECAELSIRHHFEVEVPETCL